MVLLAGAVFHERQPVGLAVLHAGDWLLKLVTLSLVAAVLT